MTRRTTADEKKAIELLAGDLPELGNPTDLIQLRLDELEKAYIALPEARRTQAETLAYAVKMLDWVLFDRYMERDSTPAPLLQLAGALKDNAEGRRSLLLDGESRDGTRSPYSRWAYRRIQGFAAGTVEAWNRSTRELARSEVGRELGIREVRPIEAARAVAKTLLDADFVLEGRGHGHEFKVDDPVERLARTVKKWRNAAARGEADFQANYDLDAHGSSYHFDEEAELKHLAYMCRLYRTGT